MKKRKSIFRRIVTTLLLGLIVLGLAAMPMLTQNHVEEDAASILMDTVQRRNLIRTIAGGASLLTDYSSDITLPEGVNVTEFLVKNGENVRQGQPIARVDDVSVMVAVKAVQESLDSLSKSIQTARGKIEPGVISVDGEGNLTSNGKKIEDSKLASYSSFLRLSSQHREYEELLLKLFLLHQKGTVDAPCDGMVQGLNDSILKPLAAQRSAKLVFLATNTPEGDDREVYTCLVSGLEQIEGDMWLLRRGEKPFLLTDFLDLEDVDLTLTEETEILPADTVFAYEDDEWIVVEPEEGDVLLYAYGSGGTTWVIRVGAAQEEEEEPTEPETEPTEPAKPGKPDKPEKPEKPTEPEKNEEPEKPSDDADKPGTSGKPGQNIPSINWDQIQSAMGGGGRGGYGGGASQAESLYSLEETVLGTVTPMEKMYLSMAVDETDVANLAVGMEADVTLDALPNAHFTATVIGISQFGSNLGGSTKFTAELELDRTENMLPGMNASITLTVETMDNVLTVPVAALVDQGANTLIYTARDEKTGELTAPVPVQTGFSDGEYVQILSGMKEGNTVYYSYYDTVEISNAVEKQTSLFG